MKIESIIRREGGTRVTLDGIEYHFQPDPEHDGRHTCEVKKKKHVNRFLAVREGFQIAGADEEDEEDEEVDPSEVDPLTDGNAGTLSPADGEDDDEPDSYNGGEDEEEEELPLHEQDPDTVDVEALRSSYQELIGEKPHPKMKVQTLQQRIAETLEAADDYEEGETGEDEEEAGETEE